MYLRALRTFTVSLWFGNQEAKIKSQDLDSKF